MPRVLSTVAVRSATAQETDQAWLLLVDITHPTLSQPARLVNNTEDIVSRGLLYQAYPFQLELAMDDAEHLPEVRMQIDNVDRLLVKALRAIDVPPDITVRLVLSSQPSTIELEISGLTLRNVQWDAFTITGTLLVDDLVSTRYPGEVVSPAAGYLGLFR